MVIVTMSTARTLEPPAAPTVRHAEVVGALVNRAAVTTGTAALIVAILGVARPVTAPDGKML